MPAANQEFESIMNIMKDIESISDMENPYTSLTKEVTNSQRFLLLKC